MNNIFQYVTRKEATERKLINDILRPIIKECGGSGMGKWYITGTHFAIATWEWTQSGFRIIGTEV